MKGGVAASNVLIRWIFIRSWIRFQNLTSRTTSSIWNPHSSCTALVVITAKYSSEHVTSTSVCARARSVTKRCVFVSNAREFGRWKVNSLALEKADSFGGSGVLAPPLDPDFVHTIRQLGRRPALQAITENLIKKYGTHLLLSATLGGTANISLT